MTKIFAFNEKIPILGGVIVFNPMFQFLSQSVENDRLELQVDLSIFSVDVCMKAAYGLLDRAYFLFKQTDSTCIVQIHPKDDQGWSAEKFALEYSDELLATALRIKVETDNKIVRETIVRRALGSYADLPHFTTIAPNNSNQIDFDKDIDEILKEIENDPDLKIDEEEINRILAEIEAETELSGQPKKPILNPNKIKDVKEKFSNR